jgi:hypothetical protein
VKAWRAISILKPNIIGENLLIWDHRESVVVGLRKRIGRLMLVGLSQRREYILESDLLEESKEKNGSPL